MANLLAVIASASSRTAGSSQSIGAMIAIIFGTLLAVIVVIGAIWFVAAKLGSRQPAADPQPPPSTQ